MRLHQRDIQVFLSVRKFPFLEVTRTTSRWSVNLGAPPQQDLRGLRSQPLLGSQQLLA
jgi:hypothetical protein